VSLRSGNVHDDQEIANNGYENPIQSITIKFNDGTSKTISSGYFLALDESDKEEGVGFGTYLMLEESPHIYLDLMTALGDVQARLAEITHNLLHQEEESH
jgi:hypothetical protein